MLYLMCRQYLICYNFKNKKVQVLSIYDVLNKKYNFSKIEDLEKYLDDHKDIRQLFSSCSREEIYYDIVNHLVGMEKINYTGPMMYFSCKLAVTYCNYVKNKLKKAYLFDDDGKIITLMN